MLGGILFFVGGVFYDILVYSDNLIVYTWALEFKTIKWIQDCEIYRKNSFQEQNIPFNICTNSCKPHFDFIYKQPSIILTIDRISELEVFLNKHFVL
jgi:hypothetical protein